MQEMDGRISALVEPLIAGEATALSETEQRDLAIWITKLSLVFESLNGDREVPDTVYQNFYASRQPIGNDPIHLGHYQGVENLFHLRRVIRMVDALSGQVIRVESVLMTIILGRLIVQTTLPGGRREMVVGSDLGTDRVGVWPIESATVTWPPQDVTTFEHLDRFSSPLTN
jgi:hypothetical protein